MNKTAVIIPTYENYTTIQNVVQDALNHNYFVIVVDDGSKKELKNFLEKNENLFVLRHKTNKGKGAAITTGTKKAKDLGFDFVVTMDGDGQHLASQIKYLVQAYKKDEIIIGARNFEVSNVPNGSKFGRWFSNFWATWDTGYEIKDSLSGFRLYPISILELPIKTSRFDWEMEVIVRHADAGKSINEVFVECYYPTAEERISHFRKFWDTAAIVWVHVQILPFKWLKYFLNLFGLKK